MRPKPLLLVLCLLFLAGTPLAGLAQSESQRDLLERAYDTKSYVLLEQFFDNWQKEYTDNEAEAPVDSAIDFRPKYQIEGLTTVYLTEGYKTIVNDYLTTFMLPPLEIETFDDWELVEKDGIVTITGNEKEPYDFEEAKLQEELERIFFLRDYAGSILCHYFLASVITPFFSIDKIIFDRSLQYAVVEYHQCKRGGTIVLKKVKNKWTFDHLFDWWVSS